MQSFFYAQNCVPTVRQPKKLQKFFIIGLKISRQAKLLPAKKPRLKVKNTSF
jgi:hypothetical protein